MTTRILGGPLGTIVTVSDDDRQWGKPSPAKTSRRPAQDEWGMFDPDQCGLGAILATLKSSQQAASRR
jgi:hypothetical protein